VDAANIIAGSKTIGHISFDGVKSPYAYALMLPQSETERLLEAHLAGLGVAVERQVELVGFTATATGITATLRGPEAREETLETTWLLGCDGAHSTIRNTLGLSFPGDTMPSDWILADIHASGLDLPASEMAVFWHQDGVLAIFPISPGRYRIVADRGPSHGPHPAEPTLAEAQAVVDRRGPRGVTLSDPVWLSGFRINERKVDDYRSGHVFVAGDAAHVHSPAGGQGMNTGMQDAFNLAWKLALVCQGTCPAGKLLDSYSVESSAIGAQVLAASGRLTAVGLWKSHAAQGARDLVAGFLFGLAPLRRTIANTMTEVSIGYAHSPLNGPSAHGLSGPAPGERAPPVSGQAAVGAGNKPRFTLFAAPAEAVSSLLRDHTDLLDPTIRPPFSDGGAWLVRPDGYTACAARDKDIGTIADYLRNLGRDAHAV
jgi:2-polyprenyl-6-methoxyphenol hydroxylase-like FAD-dependent oxidoreductase